MLARSSYPQEYVNHVRHNIAEQLLSYQEVLSAADDDKRLRVALASFEPRFAQHLLLALDGYFTHRTRAQEKKDGNALNEVRWLCDAVMNHHGVLPAPPSARMTPEHTVTGLGAGDTVLLDVGQLALVAEAFLAEIEQKYPETD